MDLFPDGSDREYGQVVTDEGRVYRFDLCYDHERAHSVRKASVERWTDITDSWQTEPLSGQTGEALIWAPPRSRRGSLPDDETPHGTESVRGK